MLVLQAAALFSRSKVSCSMHIWATHLSALSIIDGHNLVIQGVSQSERACTHMVFNMLSCAMMLLFSVACSEDISLSYMSSFPEAPFFTQTPKPVECTEGKDAHLSCEMAGTLPFQVNWYKDTRPLRESRKYKMVSEGTSVALHIVSLEQEDAGLYECRVSNNVGTESCCATVTTKGS